MNCTPSENLCNGTTIIPCACTCDNCESHDMECNGCVNCDVDLKADGHIWGRSLDPRWLVCEVHGPEEVMVAPAA